MRKVIWEAFPGLSKDFSILSVTKNSIKLSKYEYLSIWTECLLDFHQFGKFYELILKNRILLWR